MKKAIALPMLAALILTVILGLALLKFVIDYKTYLETKGDIEKCHASITLLSLSRKIKEAIPGSTILNPQDITPIDCPVTNTTFESKNAAQTLLTELKNCWYKTGRDTNKLGLAYGMLLNNPVIHCLVCSELTPQQDIPLKTLQTEFATLLNRKIQVGPGKGQTNKEYLTTSIPEQNCPEGVCYFSTTISEKDKSITKNNPYYLIRYSIEHEASGPLIEKLFDAYFGIPAPESSSFQHILIHPKSDLETLPCQEFHYQLPET